MLDNSTLGPSIGADGHLKVYAPRSCPYASTVRHSLQSFDSLNLAFQQATGWELSIRETEESLEHRKRKSDPSIPAETKLEITDLSILLPPGVPPVSRIYCEKLVSELNKLMINPRRQHSDPEDHDRERFELKAPGDLNERNRIADTMEDSQDDSPHSHLGLESLDCQTEPMPTALPFESSNCHLIPMKSHSSLGCIDWFLTNEGQLRFTAIVVEGQSTNPANVIAGQSTFLAECRHDSTNSASVLSIVNAVQRIFPAETELSVLVGQLCPLTGDLSMAANKNFAIYVSGLESSLFHLKTGETLNTHLSRLQRAIICHRPNGECEAFDQWLGQTARNLRSTPPHAMPDEFESLLNDALPSLRQKPAAAFGIQRV